MCKQAFPNGKIHLKTVCYPLLLNNLAQSNTLVSRRLRASGFGLREPQPSSSALVLSHRRHHSCCMLNTLYYSLNYHRLNGVCFKAQLIFRIGDEINAYEDSSRNIGREITYINIHSQITFM